MTDATPQLSWELLSDEPAYTGYVRVHRREYRLPDGTVAQWDVLPGGRSVSIVARTREGRFVIARQYRPGPGRVLDEVPAGVVDAGESVAEAAARELREETGYEAGTLTVIGSTWVTGRAGMEDFVAVAEQCEYAGPPQPGEAEFIEVRLLDLPEFRALARSGQLGNAWAAYRGLDHLGLL